MSEQLKQEIQHFLSTVDSISLNNFELIKLAGEASYREYYRLVFDDETSLILMKMPPGAASVAEEITKTDKKIDELPFINIQRYLQSCDLNVPEIKAYSHQLGFLLLQDLGDRSLESVILQSNDEMFIMFYKKAIDLLVDFQNKTQTKDDHCIAFYRQFDLELLVWEMNHFLEYGIEDRFKIKVEAQDKQIFKQAAEDICTQITKFSTGLVHRDFQSRNLMVYGYDLWLIDFQDALIGPKVYDLVALLRDSYIHFKPEQVQFLVGYYADKTNQDASSIQQQFDLMTLQRKLKDTGRFQYIHTVKGNSSFLKHVPLSLDYVSQAFSRLPQYKPLEQMIAKYIS